MPSRRPSAPSCGNWCSGQGSLPQQSGYHRFLVTGINRMIATINKMDMEKRIPLLARLLNAVPKYYLACSEGTQMNFRQLSKSLLFTVLVCGNIFAASFCEFWLNRNYAWMPLVFIATGLFYLLLDQAIIMGDTHTNHSAYKKIRIAVALVLGLFNSYLIDYYYFRQDIDAARITKIEAARGAIDSRLAIDIREKEKQQAQLGSAADRLELQLKADRDTLNAEADGRGGSHHAGKSTVWYVKDANYHADSLRFSTTIGLKRQQAAAIDRQVQQLRTAAETEKQALPGQFSLGISESLRLLHEVIWQKGSFDNKLMSLLILVVSMIMELIPLITKGFYDISEYFALVNDDRKVTLANSGVRAQNLIHKEGTRLMYANAEENVRQLGQHQLNLMEEDLNHTKTVMRQTEEFLNELEVREQNWRKRYPAQYEGHGKPVIERAYAALSKGIEKAYAAS